MTPEKDKSAALHSFFSEIRREFEYSIVQGQPAGESSMTTEIGQVADGVVLVISAQRTRRASARKIKEMLEAAQVRLLGTVLSDREFPIPEGIYRRL
jgi:Mrp family chromosome partitioning ATPase